MEQISASGAMTTLIHFAFQAGVTPLEQEGATAQWRIACMPNMTEFHLTPYHPAYMRTNEVSAVTCPACKKTKEFVETVGRMRKAGLNV